MTIDFRVSVDLREANAFVLALKAESPRIAGRAINKALAHSRTVSARKLAQAKNLPVNAVRRRMKLTKANARASGGRLVVLQQQILAASIGKPRQQKKGARAGRLSFPGAFVGTMKDGHTGIFKRVGKPRLPIREQGVPLLPEAEIIVPQVIRTDGERTFYAEYERLIAVKLAA